MLKHIMKMFTAAGFGLLVNTLAYCQSGGAFAEWGVVEIYSNADGSLQFIQLFSNFYGGPPPLAGETLIAGDGKTEHSFTFPSNVTHYWDGDHYDAGCGVDGCASDVLVATQKFAELNLVKPDFIVPNGFLFLPSGSVRLRNSVFHYDALPADGWHATAPPGTIEGYAIDNAGEHYRFTKPLAINALGPGFTGSWFNPAQNGHGFMLEVLPGAPMQLLASWFVFAPSVGPSWITGIGPIIGNQAVLQGYQIVGLGGRFPPNFDPTNVHEEGWGTLTFTFSDCNHGHVDWAATAPGYGSSGMDLIRLTLPVGLTCP